MGISSYYRPVVPKQSKTANYSNAAISASTFYTVLSATSGRGILSRVALVGYGTAFTNSNLQIRITIDGVANTITGGSGLYARGLVHNAAYTDNSGIAGNCFDYFCNTTFTTSLQVEVMYNTTPVVALYAVVDYQIE